MQTNLYVPYTYAHTHTCMFICQCALGSLPRLHLTKACPAVWLNGVLATGPPLLETQITTQLTMKSNLLLGAMIARSTSGITSELIPSHALLPNDLPAVAGTRTMYVANETNLTFC